MTPTAMRLLRARAERDQRYLDATGYTLDEYRAVPADVKQKFAAQRKNAKHRGIEWQFRLREWWEVWLASGRWGERGKPGFVMSRKDDIGPYAPNNVFIATTRHNSSNVRKKQSNLPTGVTVSPKGRFYAACKVDGKRLRLGSFNSASEAHRAYLSAIGGPQCL